MAGPVYKGAMYAFLVSPGFAVSSHPAPSIARPLLSRRSLRSFVRHIRQARMATMMRSSVDNVQWLADPVLVRGPVQRGFGRGSRDLGTPTANLPGHLLEGVSHASRDGVYVGFGSVPWHSAEPIKMVANLGRNITFDDVTERVLEAYLMDDSLPREFYGKEMRLCLIGFLRPELKFGSVDELIAGIANDVAVAKAVLEDPKAQKFCKLPFFSA